MLQFDGHGNVEFKPLDSNHRFSLEEERANLAKKLRDVPALQARYLELCDALGGDRALPGPAVSSPTNAASPPPGPSSP